MQTNYSDDFDYISFQFIRKLTRTTLYWLVFFYTPLWNMHGRNPNRCTTQHNGTQSNNHGHNITHRLLPIVMMILLCPLINWILKLAVGWKVVGLCQIDLDFELWHHTQTSNRHWPSAADCLRCTSINSLSLQLISGHFLSFWTLANIHSTCFFENAINPFGLWLRKELSYYWVHSKCSPQKKSYFQECLSL